jgi:hypothetical protein
MGKYIIGYVDESSTEVKKFKRFAYQDFDINDFTPIAEFDDLVSDILSSNIDALIVDHDLKEENPEIDYFGGAIIEKILSIKGGFPVFIFTSHDDDGDVTEQSIDVDIVIDKADMSNNNKNKLLKRIRQKIDNYYKQIASKEKRLLTLLNKKKKETLSGEEEDELIECDDFLEKTINKSYSIKKHFKEFYKDDVKDMIQLLNQIDEKFQKIDHSHGEK